MSKLRKYLADSGVTQAEFAERVRTTQANVSKLCGDDPRIGPDLALRIENETAGAVPVESWPQFAVFALRRGSSEAGETSEDAA